MVRQARRRSESGIYHIMQRGNERKAVFIDDEDKNRYIAVALQKKEEIEMYAYCIMDNHVHMVIGEKESGQSIETYMKRVGITYAAYFNRKYKRVGHVFQDRFRSGSVEEERYLYGVIRYVHKNPIKAGMSDGLDYPWSSYSWYVGRKEGVPLLPEMAQILQQFSSVKRFREFHLEEETETFMDLPEKTSGAAEDVVNQLLRIYNLTQEAFIQNKDKCKTTEIIKELIRETGVSGRQAAQITGINREKIRKMIVSKEPSP
jgi:putative transposase